MIRIAIIGSVGVPANYGGFETLVENLVKQKHREDIKYTVFCSSKRYPCRLKEYEGAVLKYLPLDANGSQSIVYDMVSVIRSLRYDVLLVLGTSGCTIFPFVKWICRGKIIVNIDGLEHKRDKWGKYIKRFLKLSERMAVRYTDVVVSDNKAIQDYVLSEYNKPSEVIAYGGDHATVVRTNDSIYDILLEMGVNVKKYAFSVCRIEPENNVHIALEAFAKMPQNQIIFVGNWNNSGYGRQLKKQYENYNNIKIIDPIYDVSVLNSLRSNATWYIHGHSAGGTNPSLVEAMFFDCPILCFDVVYNRETTESKTLYYTNCDDLVELITDNTILYDQFINNMKEIANRRYRWSVVVKQYEKLYLGDD